MSTRSLAWLLFLESASLLLFELLLTRVFAIVMFAQFAHLAISLALLGIAVGALLLHLFPGIAPKEKLAARLGWLALVAGVSMVLATWLSVTLPFTRATQEVFETDAVNYLSRRKALGSLWRPGMLAAIFPAIALPFVCAGITFSAAFGHFRERIGKLYAADLCGGAVGCVLFLPVLGLVSGPDAVAVAAALSAFAAFGVFRSVRHRAGQVVASGVLVAATVLVAMALRGEVLRVQRAAGFDEKNVTDVRWTPLTRLALWRRPRDPFRTYIMLDNTSRSRVVVDAHRTIRYYGPLPWSTAFQLVGRPGRIMVLAAGAGSDVTVARHFGHRDVTAVELAGGYFDMVRTHFRHVKGNPYLDPRVRTIVADARSAVKNSGVRFDVIEMMQANFWSFGGMLAEAWDPGLLFTVEAFHDYFDRLTPHGMVSIGTGPRATVYARTAVEALRARGVKHPHRHLAVIRQRGKAWRAVIVKPRPFTPMQIAKMREIARRNRHGFTIDPGWSDGRGDEAIARALRWPTVLTDDRPYTDTWATLGASHGGVATSETLAGRTADDHARVLHRVLRWQVGMLLGFGLVLIGVPFLWRFRKETARVPRTGRALLYCAALGYGFLGVEIVLIHELVLFVGHPTYAITIVLLSLLVGSGLGSLLVSRIPDDRLDRVRRIALPALVAAAAVWAIVLAPFLSHEVLGLPIAARIAITGAALFPLGLLLGTPFPLGMRILPPAASPIVPWCWAMNGWMSVLAAVFSVFIARLWGYRISLCVALAFYAVAVLASAGLRRVGEGRTLEPGVAGPAPG